MFALLLALFVVALPQAQPKPVVCSNVWQNRTSELEEYLRDGQGREDLGHSRRRHSPAAGVSDPGGPDVVVCVEADPPRSSEDGYFESYKSEIAAYELDKLLGLNMVPVVVERRVNNDVGAAVMWIEGVRSWESVLPLPKPATWGFQLARMKMFDDLISNSDRNKGNLLVDADWHIFLIDHSRAFVTDLKLPQELQNVDRQLWDRMLALDEAGLKATMGAWLDGRQIQSLIRRRDAMKKKIDTLVAKNGKTVFF